MPGVIDDIGRPEVINPQRKFFITRIRGLRHELTLGV
jgi:hypothetical protein